MKLSEFLIWAIAVGAMATALIGPMVYGEMQPHYDYRDTCDNVTHERVFLECVRARVTPSTLAAAGNDEAEAIEECGDVAKVIACKHERYCSKNCEGAP